MRTSITLSQNQHMSIFDLMREDTDDVIEVLNFYISFGNSKDNQTRDLDTTTKKNTQQRIKVNDATATGGWF